jgi:hypothetical protein
MEPMNEKQVTDAPHGHILTNIGVWSPDSRWIVYDVRSDPAGECFDGNRIEQVHVETGEVRTLYESQRGAYCGVVTHSPTDQKVAFIHGPEDPSDNWSYGPDRRRGVLVDTDRPGQIVNIDARNLTPPFTPGALRGGTHVHVFSGEGCWISFTYDDHILSRLEDPPVESDINQRNVGVSVPVHPVRVPPSHPRNHGGSFFSVLVTRTTRFPRPGSDDIERAFSDAWVGTSGYTRTDGTHQHRAIAFQGQVATRSGDRIAEAFLVDIPDDVTIPADGPLEGTAVRRPFPPRGAVQRRLTRTAHRRYPGLQGPRHWLRSSPDGSQIAVLMRDDEAIVQIWTVSPASSELRQVTHNRWNVDSAFSWSPDGKEIAYAMDNSVFVTDVARGTSTRWTARSSDETAPRPEACVFSPDGNKIAFVRRVDNTHNQIFIAFRP